MKNIINLIFSFLFILLTGVQCTDNKERIEWKINDLEYLEAPGFNVLVFHNYYPVGKQGGIEFIHHDNRIATNGYINVDLPPGQTFPRPETAERTVDKENSTITAKVSVSEFNLDYSIRVWSGNGKIHLAVDMNKPIPAVWKDKVTFDMLLYPVTYRGKTYQLGDQFGVFPVEGLGPMSKNPDGEIINMPMASGSTLIIAPEDPTCRIKIESINGKLSLLDGRNTSLGGWFSLSSTIPEGVSNGAMEWVITPSLISGWMRDPVISISQVGYHPEQVKKAIIELDPQTNQLEKAVLYRYNTDGKKENVYSDIPVRWGDWLR